MAERLPRYRPLGVRIPGVPSVNYAQTGRAQAAVFETLSRSLDQMAEFAYERQKAKVQVEGAEYGVANAPTPEQFKVAAQDPEKPVVIPGDKETVFGMAARKAAIDTAQSQLTTATRNEITALRLEAQATDMPVAEFTQKAQAIITGYGSALSAVSPAAGVNYQAGMAASVNSSVIAYAEKALEEQEKRDKANAELGISAIITGPIDSEDDVSTLADIFRAGSTYATETQAYVPISEKIQQAKNEVIRQAAPFGQAYLDSKTTEFDQKVDQLYVTSVSDWAMVSPSNALIELKDGSINDARVRDLWKNMNDDQRRAATKDIIVRYKEVLSLEASIDARTERIRGQETQRLVPQIVDAMIQGDTTKRDELLEQLKFVSSENYERLKTASENEGTLTDPATLQELNIDLLNNSLTLDNVLRAQSSGKLSNPDTLTLIGKLDASRGEDYRQAVKFLKNSVMPEKGDGFITLFDAGDVERARDIADMENELLLEIQMNPGVNRLQWAIGRIERYKTEKVVEQKQKKIDTANDTRDSLISSGRFKQGTPVQTMINTLLNSGNKTDRAAAEQLKILVR